MGPIHPSTWSPPCIASPSWVPDSPPSPPSRGSAKASPQAEITVVSPRAEFVYYPGLIWVPSGLRSGDDLRLRSAPASSGAWASTHVAGEATGLRDGGRTLDTTAGAIANDGLIIASGGRFIKKLPGIEHAITPCEGIAAAQTIRDRLRAMDGGAIAMGFAGNPNEPSAMRGGPIFEFLFGIDTQLRKERRRDRFEIPSSPPRTKPGNRLGPKAVNGLLDEMRKRDIRDPPGPQAQGLQRRPRSLTEGGEFSGGPDPLHARHDRQRLVRQHHSCRARPAG